MAAADMACIGYLDLLAEPVGAPPVVPPLGAACWRAVGAARGEALLGVSASAPGSTTAAAESGWPTTTTQHNDDDDGTPATLAWLRPVGQLLAAIATCGALVDGRVAAVSACGTRVLVRAAVRAHVGGAPRTGAAAAAAALLVAHLRCDWEHAASGAEASDEALLRPDVCGAADCRCGCGADAGAGAGADAADAAVLTHTLGALLEDLRPPRVDASAPLVPKLDEVRARVLRARNEALAPGAARTR
jgi:hypothetical protein